MFNFRVSIYKGKVKDILGLELLDIIYFTLGVIIIYGRQHKDLGK